MIIKNLKRKLLIGASIITGLGLSSYYLHTNFNSNSSNRKILKTLQENSTIIALSNTQLAKYCGPALTSSIPNDLIPELNESTHKFSFNLDLRRGKFEESQEDFAQLQVNCIRIGEIWAISSIDIKFKNSNTKWFKLFETFRLDDKNQNCHLTVENIEKILKTNLIHNSSDLLNILHKEQQFVFKPIEVLIEDKQKLTSLGTPIAVLSLLLFRNDELIKDGKLSVEGKKNNAELLFHAEKNSQSNFDLKAMALMYALKDDFILSDSELAIKYQNDIYDYLKKESISEEWIQVVKGLNISKIIEDKITKNSRMLSTIGKPIEFKCEIIDHKQKIGNQAQIKLRACGRLNNSEITLMLTKDDNNQGNSWKISNTEFKIIWDTQSKNT